MIDLALNAKGDLILYEKPLDYLIDTKKFTFFIKEIHSVKLKFSFDHLNYPIENDGPCLRFSIQSSNDCFDLLVLKDEEALKQLCYNAIRSQYNKERHFGSELYLSKNKPIQKEIKNIKFAIEKALSFLDVAEIKVDYNHSSNGECILWFDIIVGSHKIQVKI